MTLRSSRSTHICRRDDDVAAWLKRKRNAEPQGSLGFRMFDSILDDYRLHADTGTPLTEEAIDGGDPEAHGQYV